MRKFAILAILSVPSIRAALTQGEMASALIAAENTGTLEKTFKTFEEEQSHLNLFSVLADVAEQGHHAVAATCLRMAHDPFPKDKMCVSYPIYSTLNKISRNVDIETLTNVITSFKPSDIKLLASIRFWILARDDAVKISKGVMKKSPELITDDLPSWIAFHFLDRNSSYYKPVREEAFQYLISFVTQSVLEKALTILKKNEHYSIAYKDAHPTVMCCKNKDHFPWELADRIEALLKLVKARNALIREALTFLPTVIIDLMLEYATYDIPPNRSNSSPKKAALDCCLIS